MPPEPTHDHAEHEGHEHAEDTRIRVLHGASPLCHWSVGFEPALERLRLVYGDQVKVNAYQIPVYERWEQWKQDYELDDAQLAEWMAEIQRTIAMPIDPRYLSHPVQDCTPATLVYHACETAKPGSGARFNRLVAMAMTVQYRDLNPQETLLKLAEQAGAPRKQVEQALSDGSAERALVQDQQDYHSLRLNFYTLQLRDFEGRTVILEHDFTGAKTEDALAWLSRGTLRKHALPKLEDYARAHAPVLQRELEVVFHRSGEQVRAALAPLEGKSLVREERLGATFWLPR
ncbi:MAG: DsbA family protein [Halobacteriales archaeon]|nr:DsbA family protein [Halobacteriales archaeon]